MSEKQTKKRTNASIFREKSECNTALHGMKVSCATFRTLGSNSVVLFCLTFFVLSLMLISWTIWSLYVCFFLIIYIFPLYKKMRKIQEKKKRRHNCSLSCTHTKKWILSQEGQGSRVPTPRHFNVHFYDELRKKKFKKRKKKDD